MRKERALELLATLGAATTVLEEIKGYEGNKIVQERLTSEGIKEEELYKALEAAYKLIDEDENRLLDYTFNMALKYFVQAAVEIYEDYKYEIYKGGEV